MVHKHVSANDLHPLRGLNFLEPSSPLGRLNWWRDRLSLHLGLLMRYWCAYQVHHRVGGDACQDFVESKNVTVLTKALYLCDHTPTDNC